MAITPAACQAALGLSPMNAWIVRANESQSTIGPNAVLTEQQWYVEGNVDAPGRARWVTTTASDNAATQAAAILVALRL